MAVVREPVCAYLRQHCNSFATVGENRKNIAMKLVLPQSRVPEVGEKRKNIPMKLVLLHSRIPELEAD